MVSIVSIGVEGAVLGLVATLAMDLGMARLDEGATAPRVAASVLTGVRPDDVTSQRANVVHYAAGIASGILFVSLLAVFGSVLDANSTAIGAGALLAIGASALVLFVWLVGFFTVVVLPRYDAGFARQRLSRIRRDWVLAAAIHVLTLVALRLAVATLV